MRNAILFVHCPDRSGLVAAVSSWIGANGGNIEHFEQHVDEETSTFFMRAEWSLEAFRIADEDIEDRFRREVGDAFAMNARVHVDGGRPRIAIFVSTLSHCLTDLLARAESGELAVDVPLVVSNHESLREVSERHGVAFEHVPVTAENKARAEEHQQSLLDAHGVELVVLARYMQILSADFLVAWQERVINIHHSFLPAFAGARPYHRAHARGVKIIGATSHYATEDLDEGPIIAQGVATVSHRDAVSDLVRKGRDVERVVLAEAVRAHTERRVLVHHGRTVVFGS
jgi:formyltetrahydrofolate deformylase